MSWGYNISSKGFDGPFLEPAQIAELPQAEGGVDLYFVRKDWVLQQPWQQPAADAGGAEAARLRFQGLQQLRQAVLAGNTTSRGQAGSV